MKKVILAATLTCAFAAPALAQFMPPPHPAPRTPVNRETTVERRTPPKEVEGQALVLDGERLRVDTLELRLFGIVPPQLSASFGPQARATLDQLVGGGQTVACHIRDRDHDGRLLATCKAAGGDPALELLRRGLAVAARGSLTDTELSQPYIAAEQSAQNEKLGLWSMTLAAPVAPPQSIPVIIEGKTDAAKTEAPKVDAVASKVADTKDVQAKTASSVMVPVKVAAKPEIKSYDEDPSLFARYQILIAGSLMLLTTLSILGAFAIRRRNERRDEMKALAAALRGELQAARAVCMTRVKSIQNEEDDYATAWPRIRSTLYQAYVGKIGWLGAELARQIASIYGLASDYASYYNNANDEMVATTPKRQALQALASHIDKVLPRLAAIEQVGYRIDTPAAQAVAPVPRAVAPKPEPEVIRTEEVIVPQTAPPAQQQIQSMPQPIVAQPTESKLSSLIRQFRERFMVEVPVTPVVEEPVNDYSVMLEEESERFVYSEEEERELEAYNKMGRP